MVGAGAVGAHRVDGQLEEIALAQRHWDLFGLGDVIGGTEVGDRHHRREVRVGVGRHLFQPGHGGGRHIGGQRLEAGLAGEPLDEAVAGGHADLRQRDRSRVSVFESRRSGMLSAFRDLERGRDFLREIVERNVFCELVVELADARDGGLGFDQADGVDGRR